MASPVVSLWMPLAILLALGLGFPGALVIGGICPPLWVAGGAVAWAGAVAVKTIAGAPLSRWLDRTVAGSRLQSGFWGAWSAFCELGAAALAFSWFPGGLADLAGFGVGAGSIEALFILSVALKAGKGGLSWPAVSERILASIGHLASRGLVWAGLRSWVLAPAILLAFVAFTAIDGVASYGTDAGWDWSDTRTLNRYYGFVAAVTAVEVLAFLGCAALLAA